MHEVDRQMPPVHAVDADSRRRANRTGLVLLLASVVVFGFGYALVPLYQVFCEVTGINGKTGTVSETEARQAGTDASRWVTVEFDTNLQQGMPWAFHADTRRIRVHPGEIQEAVFIAENRASRTVAGQAVPSVAPRQASLYFNKTECFCFSRQELAPGERREMRVRFVVDRKLPEKISTLTLSYTFFVLPELSPAEETEAI